MSARDRISVEEQERARRESRWRAASERVALALAPCPPDACARLAPFAVIPSPARCLAKLEGALSGSRVELVEYEWSGWPEGAHEPQRFESLLLVAENPRVRGTAAIEPEDGSRWETSLSGERRWTGPLDRRIGMEEFDRAYRVYAPDAEAARCVSTDLARALLRARFRGLLELRAGALLLALPKARLSPTAASEAVRYARAILALYPRDVGGPFRAASPREPIAPSSPTPRRRR